MKSKWIEKMGKWGQSLKEDKFNICPKKRGTSLPKLQSKALDSMPIIQ